MKSENQERAVPRNRRTSTRPTRVGALNVALLFAVLVMAVSLVVTPMLADRSRPPSMAFQPEGLDTINTGSIPQSHDNGRRYTIRRSILQDTPGAVCIVDPAGSGTGSGCAH